MNSTSGWHGEPADGNTRRQEQLYRLLDKLKAMVREVPPKYQPRLSYDLLSSLAALLLDDTVLQIVAELTDLQHMTERHLHQTRCNLLARHRGEKEQLKSQQKAEQDLARSRARLHALPQMQAQHAYEERQLLLRHSVELSNCNADVLRVIDQKVAEQQSTLQQVGVPGFFVTTHPMDVRVQMYILGFIMKISKRNPSSSYS
ncbi:Gonadal family [Trinorchestia longiramus]|nr:Gonadal family [Trinorchestia longiramus]